jgi:anti-sigma B factor antagonist
MDHQRHSTSLQLETVVDHAVTHLAVGGEIDVATADELTAAGEDALARPGVNTLMINMAGVTFMSAAGLGSLVSINNNARRRGQVVIIVEASRCVTRILELTTLTDVFSGDARQTRRTNSDHE